MTSQKSGEIVFRVQLAFREGFPWTLGDHWVGEGASARMGVAPPIREPRDDVQLNSNSSTRGSRICSRVRRVQSQRAVSFGH